MAIPISTAIPAGSVARGVGIKTEFKNLQGGLFMLQQRIAVVGQGNSLATYATTKRQVTSASEAGTLFGFGSPIHLSCLQLLPVNGDGVGTIPVTVYPLEDDGSGVAAAGDITPSGTLSEQASFKVRINNIDSQSFVIAAGAMTVATVVASAVAAINAVLEMPVIAADNTTDVTITSKWEGTSANDLFIEIVEATTGTGASFAITQPVGGLVNPDIGDSDTPASALGQVGNVWETMFLNCLDVADTTTLGLYSAFGEGRWGALVKKPMVAFCGNAEATVATAITVSDARTTDRTNGQLVEPGGNDLPFVVAARQLARIAKQANDNPPVDYGGKQATGLTPGLDSLQWNYIDRNTAIEGGSSTVEVEDGIVELSDTVTFYHPVGETVPAYRYVVDIVKLQNIIYNTDLIFTADEWNGAPLIPDGQATSNSAAKRPSMAKAAIASMIDSLADAAIISDPATAKESIQVEIDGTNPKRLNIVFTVQLSGNTNIISIDLNFGFFFGS